MLNEDTIAAISTPEGTGGIGIVRISGPEAKAVADQIFTSVKGKKVGEAKGYTALYGTVHHRENEIDDAIALVFSAPASYTGEDVVELSVHGGPYILKLLLRAATAAGARLAEGGEFTKRAFLHGKLDLTQAESVMQLISAQGEGERKAALAARNGAVSKDIAKIRDFLLKCASDLAAYTDYPDEDIPDLKPDTFLKNLLLAQDKLEKILSTYDAGKMMREGIDTVIIGRPNVGKSTLMNLLSGENRSIVTNIAGTTRDIVEETVMLGDVRLKLSDTAGIHQTDDPVESIGVSRSIEKTASAQLILVILDASAPLSEEDMRLLSLCKEKMTIIVLNKSDLPQQINADNVRVFGFPVVMMSAILPESASQLESAVKELTGLAALDPSAAILASERQRSCAQSALSAVCDAKDALISGFTLDAVGVCLDEALSALLTLTGERITTAVADQVFSRFCVGK